MHKSSPPSPAKAGRKDGERNVRLCEIQGVDRFDFEGEEYIKLFDFFFFWLSSNEPAVNHRILEAEKSTDWGELNVREP